MRFFTHYMRKRIPHDANGEDNPPERCAFEAVQLRPIGSGFMPGGGIMRRGALNLVNQWNRQAAQGRCYSWFYYLDRS